MAIHRAKFRRIWFDDCNGQRREVLGLPLSKRREFVEYQEVISEYQEGFPDLTPAELYDLEADFRTAVNECLNLYGLSPDWVSLAQMVQLFFAYEGGPGLCWLLEFPERHRKGKLLNPDADPYHHAVAVVWSHHPGLSLSQVREVCDSVPWGDLEGILEARAELAEEANPGAARITEDDIEEFRQDLEQGAGIDFSGPPVGSMLDQILK